MKLSNIVIVTIIVLILLWLINRFFFQTNIIYDKMFDASKVNTTDNPGTVIKSKDINDNGTSNFMLSCWFYINNWNTNIERVKNVLIMGQDVENNFQYDESFSSHDMAISKQVSDAIKHPNLQISLDKHKNDLFIDIETLDMTDSFKLTRYRIKNIPVQKWNNLTISVDTRTLDVYLDGKLRNSFILNSVYRNEIDNKTKQIYLGKYSDKVRYSFDGFITRIRYESSSINSEEAYKIYKKGISASLATSLYNKYSLKVSFLEYNKEKGSFKI